jgi:hypothetical protein
MFLNDKQKSLKSKALADLLGEVDSLDKNKLGKKPMVAEMSVTKVEPMDKLGSAMKAAGHEGVEEKEEELFPAEEEKEEAMMEEGGGISSEEKQMIEELYNRYCR